jgi:hypothetical protein
MKKSVLFRSASLVVMAMLTGPAALADGCQEVLLMK